MSEQCYNRQLTGLSDSQYRLLAPDSQLRAYMRELVDLNQER